MILLLFIMKLDLDCFTQCFWWKLMGAAHEKTLDFTVVPSSFKDLLLYTFAYLNPAPLLPCMCVIWEA